MSTEAIVGIDLSSTFLRAGVWQNDRVEMIPSIPSIPTSRSFISFVDSECLIHDATSYKVSSTMFSITRLIGKKFADIGAKEDWTFDMGGGLGGKLQVQVKLNGTMKMLHPVEILAMMLAETRIIVQDFTKKTVKGVVLAVPASFNYAERQEVMDAGVIAGIEIVRIVNCSTAASFAYAVELDRKTQISLRNVLVVHFGDSALGASLVAIDGGICDVKATAGDSYFGVKDFDNRVLWYFQQEFLRKHRKDLRKNKDAIHRLRLACKKAVQTLSRFDVAFIELDSLYDEIDFHSVIKRERFESLCRDLFNRMLHPVETVLKHAKMGKAEVNKVIFAGAITQNPEVAKLLNAFFNRKLLSKEIHADEASVHGVTTQAAILAGGSSLALKELLLLDGISMSLGVAVGDTTLATMMIARNTSVPTRKTETFKTNVGQQSTVRIHVCDGDHYLLRKNRVLCSFDLTVIPALPRREAAVEISFDVNANGWLEVVVVEKSTGERKHVAIDAGRLPLTEVDRIRQDVNFFSDGHVALHTRSKLALKAFADSVRSSAAKQIAGLKRKIELMRADEKKAIKALRWLHANPFAEKEEFDAKRQKLEEESSTTAVGALPRITSENEV